MAIPQVDPRFLSTALDFVWELLAGEIDGCVTVAEVTLLLVEWAVVLAPPNRPAVDVLGSTWLGQGARGRLGAQRVHLLPPVTCLHNRLSEVMVPLWVTGPRHPFCSASFGSFHPGWNFQVWSSPWLCTRVPCWADRKEPLQLALKYPSRFP